MKTEKTQTDEVPARPSPTDACLILIVTHYDFEQSDVGQKHMLKQTGTTIGNTKGCDISLRKTESEVARKATLYYDAEDGIWMLHNDVNDPESRVYVNGLISHRTVLNHDDMVQLGKRGAVFRFLQGEHVRLGIYDILKNRIDEEKKLADTDALTKVPNRRVLEKDLKDHIRHCRLYERHLSAIFLDIDHFHDVNTRYSHMGGDHVLSELALRLQAHIRPLDTFARFGGEEFVVVLRDADYAKAMLFAERLRKAIEELPFIYENQTIPITASLGVSTLEPTWDEQQLLRVANHCLHQAKDRGRNRVVGYKDVSSLPASKGTKKKSQRKKTPSAKNTATAKERKKRVNAAH